MCEGDLNELVTMTRIPRAVLLCEAVDDLLEKHRVIWSRSRDLGVPSRGMLARTGACRSRSGGEAPAAVLREATATSFQVPGVHYESASS